MSSVASTTAESGSRSTAAIAAPIPTATAGVKVNPGRREAMIPPAAARNSAGNTGPPRKLPSESMYARPLNTITSASAPSDHVPACVSSPGSASCPENRTSLTLSPGGPVERDREPSDDQADDREQDHDPSRDHAVGG